ncbi:hypothetical protein PUN28_010482 [Cardiocondyla obscurior]|uniref:Uncharacterized protein n=1 Tax=Cardiocondyla obscurior TaxID=286306 RepID=A0AAW2FIW0_9HYME
MYSAGPHTATSSCSQKPRTSAVNVSSTEHCSETGTLRPCLAQPNRKRSIRTLSPGRSDQLTRKRPPRATNRPDPTLSNPGRPAASPGYAATLAPTTFPAPRTFSPKRLADHDKMILVA